MRDRLLLILIFVFCFSLATIVQPRQALREQIDHPGADSLALLLGESRRLFANHFAAKADAYFHRGNYPSIFDLGAPKRSRPGTDDTSGGSAESTAASAPQSASTWIERFGNHFTPPPPEVFGTTNDSQETIPWYRLAIELDPHNVDNYATAVFVLRQKLGRTDEAERLLRDGIRENPNSYELLFELGRLYDEDRHDTARARNLWELAAYRWHEQEPSKPKPDLGGLWMIADHLGKLEEDQHNYAEAITWYQVARNVSRTPELLQQKIDDLKTKLNGAK
jgi:tetratricopeptide (TPR) repeat protein